MNLQTPKGTKDTFSDQLAVYRRVEGRFRQIFWLWGYEEIRSPSIEFLESLTPGIGPEFERSLFKFQDSDGRILALRAEMTVPAARIALKTGLTPYKPMRLCYIANVLRYARTDVEPSREFWQAGAELYGAPSVDADAEIIALLVSCLNSIGLKNTKIDIGHVALLREFLHHMNLEEKAIQNLRTLLSRRDVDAISDLISKSSAPGWLKNLFLDILNTSNPSRLSSFDVSKVGNARNYQEQIVRMIDQLSAFGVSEGISLNLFLDRMIGYYTGPIFEAYVPGTGSALGGGGRYDDLTEAFGFPRIPAIGFAIDLDKCVQALESEKWTAAADRAVRVLIRSGDYSLRAKISERLREAGIPSILSMAANMDVTAECEAVKARFAIQPDSQDDLVRIYDAMKKKWTSLRLADFIEQTVGGAA